MATKNLQPIQAPEQDHQCETHWVTVGYVQKTAQGWTALDRRKKPIDHHHYKTQADARERVLDEWVLEGFIDE